METFRQSEFEQHCGDFQFVQDNHSKSARVILRGLHYQRQQPQGKHVRVIRGEVCNSGWQQFEAGDVLETHAVQYSLNLMKRGSAILSAYWPTRLGPAEE